MQISYVNSGFFAVSSVLRFLFLNFSISLSFYGRFGTTFALTVRNLALSVTKLLRKRLFLSLTEHSTLQIEKSNS